jgi:hypothetical protein
MLCVRHLQKEKYERINKWVLWPYWQPKRRVTFDFVRFWWAGALVTLAVIVAGSIVLGVTGVSKPAGWVLEAFWRSAAGLWL